MLPDEQPLAVHRLKPVHFTYWVLENWERQKKKKKKEKKRQVNELKQSFPSVTADAALRMTGTEALQKSHKDLKYKLNSIINTCVRHR